MIAIFQKVTPGLWSREYGFILVKRKALQSKVKKLAETSLGAQAAIYPIHWRKFG